MLPEVSRQPGFVAVYMAVDPPTGQTFSISIWDSRGAADANVESGWFRAQVARFAGIYDHPPTREDFTLVHISRDENLELRPPGP
jgi:heme-degrading monooxygenase HmoA